MSGGGEKIPKKDIFPRVNNPDLFGHEGDAEIEKKKRDQGQGADTRADWYGDDSDHPDDVKEKKEKNPVEEEQKELKGMRPDGS